MSKNPHPILGFGRGIAALLQLASIALIVAPQLAIYALRQFGVEDPPASWLRIAGVAGFVLATAARIVLPGGRRRTRRERAWADLAETTGGELTIEKRGLGAKGWTGWPVVRWIIDGVEVTLAEIRRNEGSPATRVGALLQPEQELHFNVLPNNFLTRMLTSPKFVSVVQSGIQSAAKDASEAARAQAVREIGILSGADVQLGDPRLDGQLLVKSDNPDLARYVLTGGGVTERMVGLREITKGWTLQLSSAGASGRGELALELQGAGASPEALRAAKELVEAVLGSLKHNGAIAGGASQAEPHRRQAAR